jgi:hypothetical protein
LLAFAEIDIVGYVCAGQRYAEVDRQIAIEVLA